MTHRDSGPQDPSPLTLQSSGYSLSPPVSGHITGDSWGPRVSAHSLLGAETLRLSPHKYTYTHTLSAVGQFQLETEKRGSTAPGLYPLTFTKDKACSLPSVVSCPPQFPLCRKGKLRPGDGTSVISLGPVTSNPWEWPRVASLSPG